MFFVSGVFYYFLTEQVRELVQGMADAFPGGVLVFDAANRTAVKMIAKTWLRTAKIKDVGAYFAVSDAKGELSPWDSRLQVSSQGLYAGLQRFERSFRQRLFPVSCKGRGQRDENADREDRIWRQTMKYAGMPFGMWMLMKELGLYDLTPALCHLDYTMSEAGGVTNFVRQYTLASGGPYCDCGYKRV